MTKVARGLPGGNQTLLHQLEGETPRPACPPDRANRLDAEIAVLQSQRDDLQQRLLALRGPKWRQREKGMSVKQIRLSAQGKEQLIRLKAKTGINQWNILCRWAFCLSLREPTPPSPIDVPADSNVEMTWFVFAGEHHELYLALLKERLVRDGIEPSDKELNRQFRLHLHRGIGYLATPNTIRSVADLVRLSLGEN